MATKSREEREGMYSITGSTAREGPARSEARLETSISLKIGEVKGLHEVLGGKPRDLYVSVHLDQEELYRSATFEKTLNPLIAEQFNFTVPDNFTRMICYVCDDEIVSSRDQRLGHVIFTRDQLALSHEFPTEKWYDVNTVTPDSEVQGKVLVSVSLMDQLEGNDTVPVVLIKVLEAAGIASWSNCGPFSDPYCAVSLMSTGGIIKSEVRKGLIRKRTINPSFGDVFRFKLSKGEKVEDMVIKITLWHQQMICDIFLGQVHLSLSSNELNQSHSYEAWYTLCPRLDYTPSKVGSVRLSMSYHEDYILPSLTYQPLQSLLLNSLNTDMSFPDSALCILHEVSKDRSAMGQCIVKLFLQLNKFEELAVRLITVEVNSTTDPNTLFRGNSVASKVIDEFMKVVGQSYLHRTLQSCIDEIFEVKRSCEIDQTKLNEGEHLDVNMTNLLFFVEKIMSAITSSARSCPSLMKKTFSILRKLSIQQFPDHIEEVSYTAISGFIFLRFFAPAILNPKLFGLRPENPNPTVSRTLLLISKTIQNLGNIGARRRGSSLRKEDYMVPLLAELMDPQHMKAVKNYLDAIATEDAHSIYSSAPYREGFLVKRSLARKKITVKNFKKRYFVLSDTGLSYSKGRNDPIINTIPLIDMLAVERVDEGAFKMKFMLQLLQPERVLYLQAKNSVDQMEWLSALAKACYHNNSSNNQLVHSGSFSGHWTCCGSHTVEQPGCRSVSLAIKLLAGPEATSKETELNKIYRILLDSQERLLSLKDEASKSTRSSASIEEHTIVITPTATDITNITNSDSTETNGHAPSGSGSNGRGPKGCDSTVLPLRLQTICELIVIIKNLELASKSLLLKRPQKLGSKEAPYRCDSSEAYVIK